MNSGNISNGTTNPRGGIVQRPVATTTLLRRATTPSSSIHPPPAPEQHQHQRTRSNVNSDDSNAVSITATNDAVSSSIGVPLPVDGGVGSSVLGWSRMQTRPQLDGITVNTMPPLPNTTTGYQVTTPPPPAAPQPPVAIVSDRLRSSIQAVTSSSTSSSHVVPTPLSQPRKTTLLRAAAPSSSPRPTQIETIARLMIDRNGDNPEDDSPSPPQPQFIRGEKRDRFPDSTTTAACSPYTTATAANTAASPLPGVRAGTTLLKPRTVAAATARPAPPSSLANTFVYGDSTGVGTPSATAFPQPVFTTSQEEEVLFGKSPIVPRKVVVASSTTTKNVGEDEKDAAQDCGEMVPTKAVEPDGKYPFNKSNILILI